MTENRILIVDDEASNRKLFAKYFSINGYRILEAESAAAARRILHNQDVHLILLDWMLAGRSGLELLRSLKASPDANSIPVIMFTAHRRAAEDEAAAMLAGADVYVTKTEVSDYPKGFETLLRHARALLLRQKSREKGKDPLAYRFDGFKFSPSTGRVSRGKWTARLNRKEAGLLEMLVRWPGMVHAPVNLWEGVWGKPAEGQWRHTLVNKISSLRAKLGPTLGARLVCRRDEGFMFERR